MKSIPIPIDQRFDFRAATMADAGALATLHTAVADHLTKQYGCGQWSSGTTEKGVLFAMRHSKVYVARHGAEMVATIRLAAKKPWAIDTKYFSIAAKPLYLLAMAVTPEKQRRGIGRRCLEEAKRAAKELSADTIRLDAYDADAGAAGFYGRCGFTEVGRTTYRDAKLIYYEAML